MRGTEGAIFVGVAVAGTAVLAGVGVEAATVGVAGGVVAVAAGVVAVGEAAGVAPACVPTAMPVVSAFGLTLAGLYITYQAMSQPGL